MIIEPEKHRCIVTSESVIQTSEGFILNCSICGFVRGFIKLQVFEDLELRVVLEPKEYPELSEYCQQVKELSK